MGELTLNLVTRRAFPDAYRTAEKNSHYQNEKYYRCAMLMQYVLVNGRVLHAFVVTLTLLHPAVFGLWIPPWSGRFGVG